MSSRRDEEAFMYLMGERIFICGALEKNPHSFHPEEAWSASEGPHEKRRETR
jgi:hypothetical protein